MGKIVDTAMTFIGESMSQSFPSHTCGEFEYNVTDPVNVVTTGLQQKGTKYDQDKLRFDILPSEALLEVVKVITYGEKKYPSLSDSSGNTVLNWKKLSDPQNRFFSAGQRHIYSDRIGEELDQETGYYHLAHAISNLMFQLQLKIEKNKKE